MECAARKCACVVFWGPQCQCETTHLTCWPPDLSHLNPQCSSSYAFAVTGSLESLLAIRSGPDFTSRQLDQSPTPFITPAFLSAQQLLDCDSSNQGCEGGWPDFSWDYLSSQALLQDIHYNYRAMTDACSANLTGLLSPSISTYQYVPTGSELGLQEVSIARQWYSRRCTHMVIHSCRLSLQTDVCFPLEVVLFRSLGTEWKICS